MRNDDFALPDSSYSVSDIKDYNEYIVRNMKHYSKSSNSVLHQHD